MSSSSAHELFARLDETVPNVPQTLLESLRGIAFWTAIALPFLYLPLLASGLETPAVRTAFAALVACNAVALLLGHSYARE
ncbi:hypothetical protein EGH21_22200 [Halomicroarcula sp. F13]|uniref:Uncharacterized protein n=1 Tax=Haloarcula rubra TaxID=2487747 RepID=A0AAW4PZU5_9EURY|nr:hypothetical protein [Halomicroarcula rubra]MBX0325732.1 hypothetical protein [Halomicroarcula rubra]